MKKFFAFILVALMVAPAFAADTIKMVTYFPVPYASYGDLGVSGTCDVGLLGSCNLDAGNGLNIFKAASDSRALNTGSLIVRDGVLNLNSTLSNSYVNTTSLQVGSGLGIGSLSFKHDLNVGSVGSSTVQSLEARNVAYMDSLKMFGEAFPVCAADGNEISWQNLTFNGQSGVFLVCGEGEEIEEVDPGLNCDITEEECCSYDSWFNEHLDYCCPNYASTNDERCYHWDLNEEIGYDWMDPNCTSFNTTRYDSTGTNVSKCDSYTAADCWKDGQVICEDTMTTPCIIERHSWVCMGYEIW